MRPSPPPRAAVNSNGFLDCQRIVVVGDDGDDDDDKDQRRVCAPETRRDEGGEGVALVALVRVPSDALYRERLVAVLYCVASRLPTPTGQTRTAGPGNIGPENKGGAAKVHGLARNNRATTAWVRVSGPPRARKGTGTDESVRILADLYVASDVQVRFSVTGRGTRSEFPSQRHVSSSPTPADRRLLPPASFRASAQGGRIGVSCRGKQAAELRRGREGATTAAAASNRRTDLQGTAGRQMAPLLRPTHTV
jgi:hypothetical protein